MNEVTLQMSILQIEKQYDDFYNCQLGSNYYISSLL